MQPQNISASVVKTSANPNIIALIKDQFKKNEERIQF